MDLYCVGEMVIDFLPGDSPGVYIRHAGGAPANMAIAAARSGLDAGFCGKMGDDDFGCFLQRTLCENRVRILCPALCKDAVTTMAFVTLQPDGERSFTFARKPGADMMLAEEEVREEDIRRTRAVHAGSCSLSKGPQARATVRALTLGRKLGKLVSFDINYRDLLWDGDKKAAVKKILEILPEVDLLKISEEEADMVGGEGNLHHLMREYRIAVVVETLGARGARCCFGGTSFSAPVPAVNRVDTTGAGDAFWGAFVAYLLREGAASVSSLSETALRRAMEYGNVAGTLCVQKKGALESLPTASEIEAYLRRVRLKGEPEWISGRSPASSPPH